jgi:hypothetical protein
MTHQENLIKKRQDSIPPLPSSSSQLGVSVNDFNNKPVIQVLKENGIKTLFDFACLTPTMIDDLSYHPYGKWRPLPRNLLAKC